MGDILDLNKLRVLKRLLLRDAHVKVLVYCDCLAALPSLEMFVRAVVHDIYVGTFQGSTSPRQRV